MRTMMCTLLAIGVMATPSMAQDPAAQAPASTTAASPTASPNTAPQPPEAAPPKRIVMTTGFDFATAYVFRGLYQEDSGAIAPAFIDVGVNLDRGVSLNFGNWSSLHSGPSGHSGHGNAWYESDYYGSVTFTLGKLKPGALFTSYTSPNDVFSTVHELAAVVAYDDSSSPFPLSPKAIVGFEIAGAQADGGSNRGTYLELGIKPAVNLAPQLTLSVPVKTGLSLRDYYEGPTGSNRFGFFSTGVIASVPLTFMGASWEAHGGVDFLWLGDNMALLNSGDDFKPVGIVGVSFTY